MYGRDKIKIVLNYDKNTGTIETKNCFMVATGCFIPEQDIEDCESSANVDNLVKLKNAGFSAEEIIELKRKEVI